MNNQETVHSLRALADFYEERPELSLPSDFKYGWPLTVCLKPETAKAELAMIGSFVKQVDKEDFHAIRKVGGIPLHFIVKREVVCTARVVGKRWVDQKVVPPQPGQIIPGHEEDVLEWECNPILRAEESEEKAVEVGAA